RRRLRSPARPRSHHDRLDRGGLCDRRRGVPGGLGGRRRARRRGVRARPGCDAPGRRRRRRGGADRAGGGGRVRLAAHGIALELPTGWDGRIWTRAGGGPVLHAANVALPVTDGDFATRATGMLPADGVVVVLVDYGPDEAGTPLFADAAPGRID